MDAACVKRSLLDQIENLAEHPEFYCQNLSELCKLMHDKYNEECVD